MFCKIFLTLIFILNPVPLLAMSSSQMLFEKALLNSKNGFFEEALEDWNQFLELFPDEPLGWSNRGNVRFALRDFEGAIDDQTKSIEIFSSEIAEVDPYLNRGMAEEALSLWTAAEKDYNWILERDPENSSALFNLGNVAVATALRRIGGGGGDFNRQGAEVHAHPGVGRGGRQAAGHVRRRRGAAARRRQPGGVLPAGDVMRGWGRGAGW